jgi:hypothetical protein
MGRSMSATSGYTKKIESLIAERDSLRAVNAELLEALCALVGQIEWGARISGTEGYLGESAKNARAAIASARKQGEQG